MGFVSRHAQISRAAVLGAGLAIADEKGLSAVTMQAVAGRLAVTPMALYRHVTNKTDLLDGLVELLLTEFPLPAADLPWQERLTRLADSIRASANGHPGVFPLLLQRPANTAAALRVRDAVHLALTDAGLDSEHVPRAERLLSTAVLGFAASEAAGRFAHHERAVLDADFTCLLQSLRLLVEADADR